MRNRLIYFLGVLALVGMMFLQWREQKATREQLRVLTEMLAEVTDAQECDRVDHLIWRPCTTDMECEESERTVQL